MRARAPRRRASLLRGENAWFIVDVTIKLSCSFHYRVVFFLDFTSWRFIAMVPEVEFWGIHNYLLRQGGVVVPGIISEHR
jgi:hypothetical protein